MDPERVETSSRGGEPLNSCEGSVCQGETTSEVGSRYGVGCEPVTEPPDLFLGVKNAILEVDGCAGWRGVVFGSTLVYEFRLRDREGEA